MATITVKINTRSKKTKYLLGLIAEIAKTDKNVEIIDPVNDLRNSIKEMEEGKTKPISQLLK